MDVEEEKVSREEGEDFQEEEEEAPKALTCRSTVLDIDFHPTMPLICCALVSSELEIWKQPAHTSVSIDFTRIARITSLHRGEPCRTIEFNSQGSHLLTGGSDGSLHLIDANQGKSIWAHIPMGEATAINRVSGCLTLDNNPYAFLSGDEDGMIHLWDCRQQAAAASAGSKSFPKAHQDFVSDFSYLEVTKRLLSTSGDGTLGVWDLRSFPNRIMGEALSEEMDTELLSMAVLREGRKVICGTQEGSLQVFTAGKWERPIDSLVGHPQSIDGLLKLDEEHVLTGSSDGIIRILRVFPKQKLLGVLGFHDEFPIERMKWMWNKRLCATCSHDNLVRFWATGFLNDGLSDLKEMDVNGDAAMDSNEDESDDSWDDEESTKKSKTRSVTKSEPSAKKSKTKTSTEFFEDL